MRDRVYFSFATLTATGYGDFTTATSLGHAFAVVETLVGRLYLVAVVAILLGNLGGRSWRARGLAGRYRASLVT